ncbi:FUSC family protein [Mucilaginibacter lappiensis]|uniref:Putative membrane protein YccC n=1 Tax=Mucilaginibacter lappiensis TaxID=354630 RepID=A0A841J546_9SPHI|nr:FUSC family membrane protein [Mucilaginibacter lappiensis]MBB6126329.1 putative membrane protein YccC [Mucilaginibacter lappiensis]
MLVPLIIIYFCFVLNRPSFFLAFRLKESVTDALRNTLVVLMPLVLLYAKHRQMAIAMAVGALLISLTDLPGNRRNKTLTALQSIVAFLLISLLFSTGLSSPVSTGLMLVCFTFLLSMLAALGGRSTVVGTMGIVLMVFILGLRPHEPLIFSCYLLAGCIWFYLVSLIQVFVWPFRSLHQGLRETLSATADFLKAKANCYDPHISLEESYRQIITLHLRVSEKQELVRQLLLSDRAAMRESRPQVKRLLSSSIKVIGLYEQITAMHYDYEVVRLRLAPTGALIVVAELINLLAEEADQFKKDVPPGNFERYQELNIELSKIAIRLPTEERAVVNSILTNVGAIRQLLEDIHLDRDDTVANPNFNAFLPRGDNYWQKFKMQLHFQSPVLRFSLRLALLFGIGYLATLFFTKDYYSYWLLLTIVIVARPKLAVTWQRNLERLAGTFAGVVLASAFIFLIKPTVVLLVIASFALLGFFIWNRPKYGWSVCCITICVVICLSLYHGQPTVIVSARVWYSLVGCALAFAGIFIFPVWINTELEDLGRSATEGNRLFLEAVVNGSEQQEIWLARKEAHLRLARLSEGIRHARVEPGKVDLPGIEHIQVLNYRINAVIISLFLSGRKLNQKSAETIINYLNHDWVGAIHIQEISEPINGNHLLKGQELLEGLACTLAAFTKKR